MASPSELLTTSVAEFNAWKKAQDDEVDLSNVDLSDRTITGADLSGVNFRGAVLHRTRFEDCNLEEASLFKADAVDALFWKSRLSRVYVADAHLEGSQFLQCRIEGTSFARAFLDYAAFNNSLLVSPRFDGASLQGTSFYGALLVTPSFGKMKVDLSDAVVRQANPKATETHLDFFWINQDDYAIGPLVMTEGGEEGPPYTESVKRFRRGDREVIKRFAGLVLTIIRKHHRLQTCDTIIPLPPSTPEKKDNAGTLLAAEMQKLNGPKNGSGWLLRTKATLPSRVFSMFGADPERHVSSIQLAQEDAVKGRSVLMFDDFIASGSTAAACRQILLEAGAKRVLGLYLGKVTSFVNVSADSF